MSDNPTYFEEGIALEDAPKEMQQSLSELLPHHKILNLLKTTTYPYKDPQKPLIVHKAYLVCENVLTLLRQSDTDKTVQSDSMIAGDINKLNQYWKEYVYGN